jgi:hypothetical protein
VHAQEATKALISITGSSKTGYYKSLIHITVYCHR